MTPSQHISIFIILLLGVNYTSAKYITETRNESEVPTIHNSDIDNMFKSSGSLAEELYRPSTMTYELNSNELDLEENEDYPASTEHSMFEEFDNLDSNHNFEPSTGPLGKKIYPHITLPAPPALTSSVAYNMEGSEIGDATYIVPEELKGRIALPPSEPTQKTYGLAVNYGNVLRKEVRNDYGEFFNSNINNDGTRRMDIGELQLQSNGAQTLVFRGFYTYKAPNGKLFRVNYKADAKGYRAKTFPLN